MHVCCSLLALFAAIVISALLIFGCGVNIGFKSPDGRRGGGSVSRRANVCSRQPERRGWKYSEEISA